MEQTPQTEIVSSDALKDVVQNAVKVETENAQLKSENADLQSKVQAFDAKLEEVQKSLKAENAKVAEDLVILQKNIAKPRISNNAGEEVAESDIEIVKSVATKYCPAESVQGFTQPISMQDLNEKNAKTMQKIAKSIKGKNIEIQCKDQGTGSFLRNADALEYFQKSIWSSNSTLLSSFKPEVLLATLETKEVQGPVYELAKKYVVDGTDTATIVRKNFNYSVKKVKEGELPTFTKEEELNNSFIRKQYRLQKYVSASGYSYEAQLSAAENLQVMITSYFPEAFMMNLRNELITPNNTNAVQGFLPDVVNDNAGEYTYNIKTRFNAPGATYKSLSQVIDFNEKVGYIETANSGAIVKADIRSLISSLSTMYVRGSGLFMNRDTFNTIVELYPEVTQSFMMQTSNASVAIGQGYVSGTLEGIPVYTVDDMPGIEGGAIAIAYGNVPAYYSIIRSASSVIAPKFTNQEGFRYDFLGTDYNAAFRENVNAMRFLLIKQ